MTPFLEANRAIDEACGWLEELSRADAAQEDIPLDVLCGAQENFDKAFTVLHASGYYTEETGRVEIFEWEDTLGGKTLQWSLEIPETVEKIANRKAAEAEGLLLTLIDPWMIQGYLPGKITTERIEQIRGFLSSHYVEEFAAEREYEKEMKDRYADA